MGHAVRQASDNLVTGYEDMGKGLLECYCIAEITNGRWSSTPERVAIVSTEDSYEEDLKPRLVAAGANLDLCIHLDPGDVRLHPNYVPSVSQLESTRTTGAHQNP